MIRSNSKQRSTENTVLRPSNKAVRRSPSISACSRTCMHICNGITTGWSFNFLVIDVFHSRTGEVIHVHIRSLRSYTFVTDQRLAFASTSSFGTWIQTDRARADDQKLKTAWIARPDENKITSQKQPQVNEELTRSVRGYTLVPFWNSGGWSEIRQD